MKLSLIAAIVLALVGLGVYGYAKQSLIPGSSDRPHVTWQFEDNGYDETTLANTTTVYLHTAGRTYDAGTYNGSCWVIGEGNTTEPLENEISGVQCWFAGGGDEVGVFAEKGRYVVKHGELGEPQGDGTPPFRGNFTAIFAL